MGHPPSPFLVSQVSDSFCPRSQSRNPTFLCCSGCTAGTGDTGLKQNSISYAVRSSKSQLQVTAEDRGASLLWRSHPRQEIRSGVVRGNQKAAATVPFAGWGDGTSQRSEGFQIKSIPFKSLANFVCNSFQLEWNSNKSRHPGVRPGGAVKVTLQPLGRGVMGQLPCAQRSPLRLWEA